MKHPLFEQLAPNTRRKFLHLAAAPVSSLLLAACGRGAAAAETTLPPVPPHAPQPATGALPNWVDNLPLWQWHEIPNTALSSVDPAVRSLGNTGPRSKIDAWCGACLKRRGSVYMLGAAGGHSDYAGNEVDALALNVATPRWNQLRGPTSNSDIISGVQFYRDLRPSATHTYYATQFIETLNRMLVFASGGAYGPFPPAPSDWPYRGSSRSFSFNVATGDWDPPDYVAQFPGTGKDINGTLCVKHPLTSDVYYSRNYAPGWYRWESATNTWSMLSKTGRSPWYGGAAIDPLRNRMLIVGGYRPCATISIQVAQRIDGRTAIHGDLPLFEQPLPIVLRRSSPSRHPSGSIFSRIVNITGQRVLNAKRSIDILAGTRKLPSGGSQSPVATLKLKEQLLPGMANRLAQVEMSPYAPPLANTSVRFKVSMNCVA